MTEPKPLSEMTDDEIIAEIQALRERRAQARERRVAAKDEVEKTAAKRKGPEKVSDSLWDLLSEDPPKETTE